MNKIQFFSFAFIFLCTTLFAKAQSKTEVIPVSGNCDMCKARIEKAAKIAGVSYADWDPIKKQLTVKYEAKETDATKIQQAVADAGHNTKDINATDEAYSKLPSCCHYDRTKAIMMADAKDGKCKEDHKACGDKKDAKCCKDKLAANKPGVKAKCADQKEACKKEGKDSCEKRNAKCCKDEAGIKSACADKKEACKKANDKKPGDKACCE
jgi:periplasmic mercuric ion binding protein